MSPSKRSPYYGAEVSFAPELRNCLVNLPSPLANAIADKAGVKIQDIVVEIAWSVPPSGQNAKPRRKIIGAGWTGMPSTKQQNAAIDSRGKPGKAPEVLEIDPGFARSNALENGHRVRND